MLIQSKFGNIDIGVQFKIGIDTYIKIQKVVDYENANRIFNSIVLYSVFLISGIGAFIEDSEEIMVLS